MGVVFHVSIMDRVAFIYILKNGLIASLEKLSGNFYSIIVGPWKKSLVTAEQIVSFHGKKNR